MSKRPRPSPDPPSSSEVHISESIHDRASTFIAHYSPTLTGKRLQAEPSFKSATHRIAAWRRPSAQRSLLPGSQSTQRTLYDTGHDDDGEKYAGKRLEKVLETMNVEGTVVVARWYGGVLLGPVRFTHIETCARDAIRRWQETLRQKQREEDEHSRKRVKAEQDEPHVKDRLIGVLQKRDQSIGVLRELLEQKKREAAGGKETSSVEKSDAASPVKRMDYTIMTLVRLRALEKARDASIAWLLKQIDDAEKKAMDSAEKAIPEASGKKSQVGEAG